MAVRNQFITKVDSCVEDMLQGVAATFPQLSVDPKSRIVFSSQSASDKGRKVGLLSGGGSGHEPFAAGYVGDGMLTAAVAGSVFASPPPSHIFSAICDVASISPGGVLLIFNNYTGDVLNFGLALERAKGLGYNVKSVIVDEDCSIDKPEGAGKRGLCGCLFIIKIAGGLASMSKSLEEIYEECSSIKENVATLGVTIKPCNMPGLGPMFELEDGCMSVGVGIHGEAGVSKTKMVSADKIVEIILEKLCKSLNIKSGTKVCVMVNNLGGSSQLELFLVAGQVSSQLRGRGVEVVRQYTGTLLTSLDMAGVQVSLLVLPEESTLWLQCLDSHTSAPAWPASSLSVPSPHPHPCPHQQRRPTTHTQPQVTGQKVTEDEAQILRKCLIRIANSLLENESKLNELDKGCGDGDTGSTLRRMADAILREVDRLPVQYPQSCLLRLSQLAEDVMGGTSGALYSLMLVAASRTAPDWPTAWQQALTLAMTYSKARVGSRTMFDALIPACEALQTSMSRGGWRAALTEAVKAADEGCNKTQHLKPLFGRASYVEASNMRDVDAGAFGVTVWLHAVKSTLLEE